MAEDSRGRKWGYVPFTDELVDELLVLLTGGHDTVNPAALRLDCLRCCN